MHRADRDALTGQHSGFAEDPGGVSRRFHRFDCPRKLSLGAHEHRARIRRARTAQPSGHALDLGARRLEPADLGGRAVEQ